MNSYSIDINADIGEGINNEADLLPLLTSCNIACGGHTGDKTSMKKAVLLAKEFDVKIGAHPSFPDKEYFGREPLQISNTDLYISLKKQIDSLITVLLSEGVTLHHIKPHGALYNTAMNNKTVALVIIEVIKNLALPVALYAPFNSVIANLAIKENIPVIYEAFADRNYVYDYTLNLMSRKQKEAIITNPEAVIEHVLRIITKQKVKTINGLELPIAAKTFCIHGDNPKALNLVKSLRQKLPEYNIEIE